MNLSINESSGNFETFSSSGNAGWVIPFAMGAIGAALCGTMMVREGAAMEAVAREDLFQISFSSSIVPQEHGAVIRAEGAEGLIAFVQDFAASQKEMDPAVAKLFADNFANYLD